MERKSIVIYKSSTGFTKKYAEMIAEELKCGLADYRTVTARMLAGCEVIIFGSRAHAGRIDGYRKIKELLPESSRHKLILFVTGATPNDAKDMIAEFWRQNLTAEELAGIPHFYMQGGLCYEKMSLPDRWMMKAFAFFMKKKKDKNEYEKKFEQAIARSYDISDQKYIAPLVAYVKENR